MTVADRSTVPSKLLLSLFAMFSFFPSPPCHESIKLYLSICSSCCPASRVHTIAMNPNVGYNWCHAWICIFIFRTYLIAGWCWKVFFIQLWPSILGQLYGFLSSPLDSKASRTWSIDLKKSLMREREPYLFPACCDHCCWCVDGASVFVNITLLPAIVYPAPIGNEWPAAPALHAQLEAGWTAVPFIRFFSSLCFHWVRRSFMGFAVLCCTCSVFIGSTSIPVQMALLPMPHAVTLNLCYCGNNR